MKLAKRKYKPLQGEYDIRRDDVFKIVFGSNERSEYLKAFLESILHKKITNIVVRNDVALDKVHADNKLMRLDILAEIDGKEKINIEMQNRNEYNIVERNDSYASGIYYNSIRAGKKYIEATKTVIIWILGYNCFKDGNYHEIIKQRREYNNEVFSPNITTHIFQLPKFIENVEEIRTEEEQWLAYLSGNLNKEEMEELFKMNRSIEEINKIVDIVMTDDDVWDAINDRILAQDLERLKMERAYENGEKAGKECGKEEGKKENSIKIAKEMLKDGFEIEKIAKLTGLEENKVIELKKELD